MIIEDYLEYHAANSPDKTAIVCGGKSYDYRRLNDMAKKRAESIRQEEKKVIPLRAANDADFLVNYFAIHLAGAVAVPLSKDCPDNIFTEISDSLQRCDLPKDTADILFTTGTTGKAKGVIISRRAIIANAENLISAQGYTPDLTFIITGPLNHIGSLSKVFPVIVQGATLHIIDGMRDLNVFYNALERTPGKTATFLVPASIRMLIMFSTDKLKCFAGKIEFIETGGATLSEDDMRQLCSLLPHSRLYNTYASTETGIISTYDFSRGKCVAGCVGRTMKHSAVEISSDGTVVCKGATLMSGYVDDADLESILSDGAFHTHDLGYIDSDGLLRLQGRNDDIFNIGGFKVAPEEVESVALKMDGIFDCICVAVNHPISGNALKLLVVPKGGSVLSKRAVAAYLNARLENYKVPLLYQFVKEIKRTFNGKLDRKAYRT